MTTKFIAGTHSLSDLQKAIAYEELLFRKSTGVALGSLGGTQGNLVTFTDVYPKAGRLSLSFSSAPAPANSTADWTATTLVNGSPRQVTAWRPTVVSTVDESVATASATTATPATLLAPATLGSDESATEAESVPDLLGSGPSSPYSVQNGTLLGPSGKPVRQFTSPNQSSGNDRSYLVIHYTAGTSMTGAVSWFMNKAARASAHLVIARDGSIVQMVPFTRRAWHAGESKWQDLIGLNAFSIGIELVNAGKLRRSPAGWVTWSDILIPDEEVTVATHRNESQPTGWHEYTPAQLDTLFDVAVALHDAYQFKDVLGHDDIAPKRKVDPGPLFPIESFRGRLFGRE